MIAAGIEAGARDQVHLDDAPRIEESRPPDDEDRDADGEVSRRHVRVSAGDVKDAGPVFLDRAGIDGCAIAPVDGGPYSPAVA